MKGATIAVKMHLLTIVAASILLVVLLPKAADAMPSGILRRQKRISDQRLAELETIYALSTLHGMLSTVRVGHGTVNPEKAGRRRRSSMESGFRELQQLVASRRFHPISKDRNEASSYLW